MVNGLAKTKWNTSIEPIQIDKFGSSNCLLAWASLVFMSKSIINRRTLALGSSGLIPF